MKAFYLNLDDICFNMLVISIDTIQDVLKYINGLNRSKNTKQCKMYMQTSLSSKRSRAREDSGRAKIRARAKKGKEQGGSGATCSFPFFVLTPIFARPRSSLARDTKHFARTGTLTTQATCKRLADIRWKHPST